MKQIMQRLSELESIYGSGVVWTSSAMIYRCGGSPPWDCGDGGFMTVLDIPRSVVLVA